VVPGLTAEARIKIDEVQGIEEAVVKLAAVNTNNITTSHLEKADSKDPYRRRKTITRLT
jgi:hypothetical protein